MAYNEEELWHQIQDVWSKIDEDWLQRLVDALQGSIQDSLLHMVDHFVGSINHTPILINV